MDKKILILGEEYWFESTRAREDYKDADTGLMFSRSSLNDELERIEKPAGIGPSAKDFRNEI